MAEGRGPVQARSLPPAQPRGLRVVRVPSSGDRGAPATLASTRRPWPPHPARVGLTLFPATVTCLHDEPCHTEVHPRLGCGPPLGARRRVLPSAAVLAKVLHGAPPGGPRPPAGRARVPSAWPPPAGVLAAGAAALPRPAAPPAPPRPGRPATPVPPPRPGASARRRAQGGRRSGRRLKPRQAQAQRPLQPDHSHPWLPTAPPEPRPRKPQVRPRNTQAPPPGVTSRPGTPHAPPPFASSPALGNVGPAAQSPT